MKISNFLLVFSMALLGLGSPLNASAETLEATPVLLAPEAPTPITVGNVTYLSGGVGDSEAEAIRAIAKSYALEVVFVQKLKQREEFLASVKVKIQDHHHNLVLDINTEGPYLLANLPAGHYQVIAEHNGVVKQQWLMLGDTSKNNDSHKKTAHKKIVFWWPILEEPDY